MVHAAFTNWMPSLRAPAPAVSTPTPAGKFLAASADEQPTGLDLYSRFAFAGAMCCAVTHGALTPVDVVKTRMQLQPEIYKDGMIAGFRQVIKAEGAGALLTGFAPTCAGYFLQGGFKFGGYEFFKKQWVDHLGAEEAKNKRLAIYLSSAGMAEFFADVALCPLEAARIRLVQQPDFATSLPGCAARIVKEQGVLSGFYGGFIPMLFKQVPYTMAKFVVYETLAGAAFKSLGGKDNLPNSQIVGVNLGCGVGAGVAAAIISQPADTLLSKINKSKTAGGTGNIVSRLGNLAGELGAKGLFLGTGARCVMVGAITAGQFAIYGDIKRVLNATGGTEIAA